jgi:hypothetical protein
MVTQRRNDAFLQGQGIEPPEPVQHVCAECGYAHANRRNFKRTEDGGGYTCSTGHYEKNGELKRQKNAYARP